MIGHQFGGSDKLENIVPMNRDLNEKYYVTLENFLAKMLKLKDLNSITSCLGLEDVKAKLQIEPQYKNVESVDEDNEDMIDAEKTYDNNRPNGFEISYTIENLPYNHKFSFNNS